MDLIRGYETRPKWKKVLTFIFMIVLGCLLNFTGSEIAYRLDINLYLDSIGTILCAMLGGNIPGITVGLLSSVISGIVYDMDNLSYSALAVFIALFTTYANEKKWFERVGTILLSICVYALLGGTLGSLITMYLYGFGQEETSAKIVYAISNLGIFPNYISELLGDSLTDLVDKSISLCIVLIIYHIFPKSIRGDFRIHSWQQTPLTRKAVSTLMTTKTGKKPLLYKLFFILGLASLCVGVSAFMSGYLVFRNAIITFGYNNGISVTDSTLDSFSAYFIASQISLFVGFFIFIVAVFGYLARYHIILPLNTMAYVASEFSKNGKDSLEDVATIFEQIKIATEDETENLYNSINDLLKENCEFLDAINKKNATIAEMQNALIVVLADMVESRDLNTGNHIKATAEYVELIMDEMLSEGIYKEQMTPEFVSDVYQSAPLHDLGKISVSDTILNKPGRLTDEEMDIMRKHPQAGADIIEKVINALPESEGGYLYEAKNLALYHHEKWDGSGYPSGLSGEDIPLSARIMAVADVFDALVSKRSYKEPFSFEKAISIIEESKGTHFDPLIAQAFLNAKDRMRTVAEEKDSKDV